jgi:hypothetical protein
LKLSERCDDDSEDDERNVSESLHVRRSETEDPAGEEDNNRGGGLFLISFCIPHISHSDKLTLSIWMKETLR